MNVLAKRSEETFLVSDQLITEQNENPPALIVKLNDGAAYPMPAQQALKWGYWEELEPGSISAETMKSIEIAAANIITDEAMREAIEKEWARFNYRQGYIIRKGNKKVGAVTFGGVPAIEITSQNEKLVGIVTKAMVNPVEVEDGEGGTIYSHIGDIQYEQAVVLLIQQGGFRVEKQQ